MAEAGNDAKTRIVLAAGRRCALALAHRSISIALLAVEKQALIIGLLALGDRRRCSPPTGWAGSRR